MFQLTCFNVINRVCCLFVQTILKLEIYFHSFFNFLIIILYLNILYIPIPSFLVLLLYFLLVSCFYLWKYLWLLFTQILGFLCKYVQFAQNFILCVAKLHLYIVSFINRFKCWVCTFFLNLFLSNLCRICYSLGILLCFGCVELCYFQFNKHFFVKHPRVI